MIKVGPAIVIGIGALGAASLLFSFSSGDRELHAGPLAEVFAEACLKTAAIPEAMAVTAREQCWSGPHLPVHTVANWTMQRSGQMLRVYFLRQPGITLTDSCSASTDFGAGRGGQVAREAFLTEMRRVLDQRPSPDGMVLEKQPYNQRRHYDGTLRYDSYRLSLPATEAGRAADDSIEVALEVSIKRDRVSKVVAWWRRPRGFPEGAQSP